MPGKRNAQGAGNIRQRKDGTWEARYTTGRDPGTGKQLRRSVYGKSQKEVLEKLKAVHADIQNGVYVEPSKLTLKAWLKIWLDEYISDVKPLTASSYAVQVNNHITPALGAVKLPKLTAPAIQSFYNDLQREKGLSPKTVRNVHGVLHRALEQAVRLGYLRVNPSTACTLPRVEKKEIKPLDDTGMDDFLTAIEDHPNKMLYTLDLFTGMRQGEILGLRWECVDFENGTIFIDKQLQKEKKKNGEYFLAPLKNNKTRTISPASLVMQALREHKKKQNEYRLRAGKAWGCGLGDLVFTNEIGGHLCHFTVWKHFKAIVVGVGLSETRFHDLRHPYVKPKLKNFSPNAALLPA